MFDYNKEKKGEKEKREGNEEKKEINKQRKKERREKADKRERNEERKVWFGFIYLFNSISISYGVICCIQTSISTKSRLLIAYRPTSHYCDKPAKNNLHLLTSWPLSVGRREPVSFLIYNIYNFLI